jgi:NTE family protein
MFDGEFTEALIEMAQRDAHRWLRRHPAFWCRDAAHDLSVAAIDRGRVQEAETLDEFRSMHRR